MQIWVHLNGVQQGPYSLEQIRLLPIEADTPVWYEGLPKWLPASEAPATAGLFGKTPAANEPHAEPVVDDNIIDPMPGNPDLPPRPATYLAWNIIFTVLCCCPVALAGIITGAISSSRYSSGDFEGSRRMSNVTAWLLIISVVWVILSVPFSLISWIV